MPRAPFALSGRRTALPLEGVGLLVLALLIGSGPGLAESPCPPRADGTRAPAILCNGQTPPQPRPRPAAAGPQATSEPQAAAAADVPLDAPVVRPKPLSALTELPLPRPRPQAPEVVGVLPFPAIPTPRPAPGLTEAKTVAVADGKSADTPAAPLAIVTPQPLSISAPKTRPGEVLGTRTGLLAQIGRWAADPTHTGSLDGSGDKAKEATPASAPAGSSEQVQKMLDEVQGAAVARAAQSLTGPGVSPIETEKDPAGEKSVADKPVEEAAARLPAHGRPAASPPGVDPLRAGAGPGASPVDNLPAPDSIKPTAKPEESAKTGDKPSDKMQIDDAPRLRAAARSDSSLLLTINKNLPTLNLAEVVGRAVSTHPEIGQARARAAETRYGVLNSRSALHPQIDASIATGQGTIGQYEHVHRGFDSGDSIGSGRLDAQLQVRQRLFDFGAARQDILRSTALHDAERWKLLDKIEDIALRTSAAYMKILETRELLTVANENVTELEHFARIVDDNQRNGNGTIADVKRVQSRLIDAQTMRTDIESQMQQAIDQFRRLVGVEPGQLRMPPQFKGLIPNDVMKALQLAPNRSTSLLAASANVEAIKRELETQRALGKPRVNLELASSLKNYMGVANRSEIDVRGMIVFSHKLYDGGAQSSQISQVGARLEESQMKYIAERDNVEADLRQYYRAISASRRKLDTLREGVAASKKVKELYTQQFQAGKRTLFEVLDSQMQYYTAQRDGIVNQYEELRGIYGILRSLSRLSETILAATSTRTTK